MYCGDKYDAAHATSCTKMPHGQVHTLVLNDLDQPLSEEVLTQLAMEDSVTDELQHLSLNALAGTTIGEVLHLKGMIKNKVMVVLLDSGNSHSFVSASFLTQVGISPVSVPPKQVKVANGQLLVTDKLVPAMEWWCQGHTLVSDMQVLDLGGYDAILGYDWLKLNSPMTCNRDKYSVQFQHKGKNITLQGTQSSQLTATPLSADKLVRLHKGNDIWALAMVHQLDSTASLVPSPMETLLTEFEDVFSKPSSLPPQRTYDHTIPLLPDAVPVNSRPYRYSPMHKDEIERQVKELLQAGLITHSTSPFASPVLLV